MISIIEARPQSRLPQNTESNSCEHNCSQGNHQLSVPATYEAHTAQVPHNVSQVELLSARRGIPSRYTRTALSVEHVRSAMITRLTGWSSAVWTSDGDELEDREEHVDADDSSPSESEICPFTDCSKNPGNLTKKLAHLIATKCRNTFSTLSPEHSNSRESLSTLPAFQVSLSKIFLDGEHSFCLHRTRNTEFSHWNSDNRRTHAAMG